MVDEGCAFEELISFHGGLGGPQTRPFILAPPRLPLPAEPIIGAAAVHALLSGWRRLQGPATQPRRPSTSRGDNLMADDWRATIELAHEGHREGLFSALRGRKLAHEAQEQVGERVIVTHDGPRVFLYTDTEPQLALSSSSPRRCSPSTTCPAP